MQVRERNISEAKRLLGELLSASQSPWQTLHGEWSQLVPGTPPSGAACRFKVAQRHCKEKGPRQNKGRLSHAVDISSRRRQWPSERGRALEWCEICQQYVGSFFSRNIRSTPGSSQMLAGLTSSAIPGKENQFSALLPITSKKKICFNPGWQVCASQVVRSSAKGPGNQRSAMDSDS